jgi:hypothetical protein
VAACSACSTRAYVHGCGTLCSFENVSPNVLRIVHHLHAHWTAKQFTWLLTYFDLGFRTLFADCSVYDFSSCEAFKCSDAECAKTCKSFGCGSTSPRPRSPTYHWLGAVAIRAALMVMTTVFIRAPHPFSRRPNLAVPLHVVILFTSCNNVPRHR